MIENEIKPEITPEEGKGEINEVELSKLLGLNIKRDQNVPRRQTLLTKKISLDDQLPEEATKDKYYKSPLDAYGEKMLKTMGMGDEKVEGSQLTRRPKDVVQYNPRPDNLGLGAIPKKELLDKIKSGQDITSKDLRSRIFNNISGTGEKDDGSLKQYDRIKVIGGKYEGLFGMIIEVDEHDDQNVTVQLHLNQKNVKIQSKWLEKSTEVASNPSQRPAGDIVSPPVFPSEFDIPGIKKRKKLKWIMPNIVLRIVSKDYRGGKFYEETGYVNDILDPRTFVFVMKSGEILEDLEEKQLETVMPKLGEKVLILKGDHKGVIGVLKERNKKDNSVMVKIEENQMEFIKMTQDDCSAYHEQN